MKANVYHVGGALFKSDCEVYSLNDEEESFFRVSVDLVKVVDPSGAEFYMPVSGIFIENLPE